MSKQIVTYPAKRFIDRKADSYILMDTYIDQIVIHGLIEGNYESIGFPYKNEKEVLDSNQYIVDLTRRFIRAYVSGLNRYHKVELNERQWNTLLCTWLRFILFDSFTRYKQLKPLVGKNVYMLAPKKYEIEKNMADSYRGLIRSELKNAYMWAVIAHKLGIEIKGVREKTKVEDFLEKVETGLYDHERVKEFVHRKICRTTSDVRKESIFNNVDPRSEVLLYETSLPVDVEKEFGEKSEGRLCRIDGWEMRQENVKIIGKYEVNNKARKLLSGVFRPQNEFEEIAERIVVQFLPVAYFEAFRELYDKAEEITNEWNIKEIFTTYSSVELMDFCCMLQQKKGMKINIIQHSGVYGGMPAFMIDACMYADLFLTWGWTRKQFSYLTSEIKPVVIIRFPKKQKNQPLSKNKILVVCNYGMYSDGGAGFYYGNYVKNQMKLIEKLDNSVRNKIVMRIDPRDELNLELMKRCKKKYPCVKFENRYKVSYYQSVMESRFVISDYYGSTHLEAMLLGKPVIMYDAAAITVCSEIEKNYREDFRRQGVFANSPEEMAEILNFHADNDEWLKLDSIKNSYKKYLSDMAGIKEDMLHDMEENLYKKWYQIFIGENGK